MERVVITAALPAACGMCVVAHAEGLYEWGNDKTGKIVATNEPRDCPKGMRYFYSYSPTSRMRFGCWRIQDNGVELHWSYGERSFAPQKKAEHLQLLRDVIAGKYGDQ